MSDPRFTDPRYSDPRLSDPVLRPDDSGGLWGWVAGIAVLALIAFVVIAGWSGNRSNVASTNSAAPITTGSAPSGMTPRTTTGSGATSPQPMSPPAKSEKQ